MILFCTFLPLSSAGRTLYCQDSEVIVQGGEVGEWCALMREHNPGIYQEVITLIKVKKYIVKPLIREKLDSPLILVLLFFSMSAGLAIIYSTTVTALSFKQ